MTANMVPVCSMTRSRVICGAVGSRPRSFSATITWAELETGRSSASPCTIARIASCHSCMTLNSLVWFERHALADAAEEFVRNRAGVARDFFHRQARAPEHRGGADRDTLDPGHVHGDHVHRHPPDERGALVADQHRGPGLEAARHAIAVAGRDDGDAGVARRAPAAAVADALAAAYLAHGEHRAHERHHRPQVELRRAHVREG